MVLIVDDTMVNRSVALSRALALRQLGSTREPGRRRTRPRNGPWQDTDALVAGRLWKSATVKCQKENKITCANRCCRLQCPTGHLCCNAVVAARFSLRSATHYCCTSSCGAPFVYRLSGAPTLGYPSSHKGPRIHCHRKQNAKIPH